MADVFLSYSRQDKALAARFVDLLEGMGWDVFWDQETRAGTLWPKVLEEELGKARCLLVLWTSNSVASRWVRIEAYEALQNDKLLPVLIEKVKPPLEFRQTQIFDLVGWTGEAADPRLPRLFDDLSAIAGCAPPRRKRADGPSGGATASEPRPRAAATPTPAGAARPPEESMASTPVTDRQGTAAAASPSAKAQTQAVAPSAVAPLTLATPTAASPDVEPTKLAPPTVAPTAVTPTAVAASDAEPTNVARSIASASARHDAPALAVDAPPAAAKAVAVVLDQKLIAASERAARTLLRSRRAWLGAAVVAAVPSVWLLRAAMAPEAAAPNAAPAPEAIAPAPPPAAAAATPAPASPGEARIELKPRRPESPSAPTAAAADGKLATQMPPRAAATARADPARCIAIAEKFQTTGQLTDEERRFLSSKECAR